VAEELVPQEVIVEALDQVTIKVTIDGNAQKEISMAPDQIQTFKARGKIKIVTPNGGGISVIHNGFDLGVPGNLGQPKTLVFPK
jgi:cytoskeleton protein RodZ